MAQVRWVRDFKLHLLVISIKQSISFLQMLADACYSKLLLEGFEVPSVGKPAPSTLCLSVSRFEGATATAGGGGG